MITVRVGKGENRSYMGLWREGVGGRAPGVGHIAPGVLKGGSWTHKCVNRSSSWNVVITIQLSAVA